MSRILRVMKSSSVIWDCIVLGDIVVFFFFKQAVYFYSQNKTSI